MIVQASSKKKKDLSDPTSEIADKFTHMMNSKLQNMY